MFTAGSAQALKAVLPEFSLTRPCNLSRVQDELAVYMAHYGFFETLKPFDGEYFVGYKKHELSGQTYRVATQYWQHPEARGTVVFVHGLFDHVGLFQKLILHCLTYGYSVLAVDLPGHGLSDGEPTAIGSFFDYAKVVSATLTVLPNRSLPVYGVGQSTGAAVLMAVAFKAEEEGAPSPFERLVFLGPLIRPCRWRMSRLTLKVLGGILKTIHRDMAAPNSHDEEFHFFLRYHDPLQSKRLSVSWAKALDEWVQYCAKAPVVETPLLIVQGTQDKVVDWKNNVPQIQAIFCCNQLNYIEGAMHHLGNEGEPWRKTIYTSITQFLKQKVVC